MDNMIKSTLVDFLENMGVQKSVLNNDPNVFADGIIDSLQAIDYLVMIEEKFNINITMNMVIESKLGRLSDMARYIEESFR